MSGFIYVVARDYGFAPNPFSGFCTLATCKPGVREHAQIGDWIIGVGSIEKCQKNKLVYLMQVTRKITYNEYWTNPSYSDKKPVMNGSLKQMYGDNIYYLDEETNQWTQADSHHSYKGGITNEINLRTDTSSKFVLISNNFYYFGKDAIEIPKDFREEIYWSGRKYKKVRDLDCLDSFIRWVEKNFQKGYHSGPLLFESFKRYDGRS